MFSPSVYSTSAEVLQRRQQLAIAFSGLRNLRPRLPFWKLAAHRIPVLWCLYRSLLKSASGENTRWRIRVFFEEHRHLTSPKQTKAKLEVARKLLGLLQAARDGNSRGQQIVERYESMIGAKRKNEHMKTLLRKAWAWQHRLDHRPILTGALLRPSLYNGPLPRMRPQPEHVSVMIYKRKLVDQGRIEKLEKATELREDMRIEKDFESSLASLASKASASKRVAYVFRAQYWDMFMRVYIRYLKNKHWEAIQRSNSHVSSDVLSYILAARREKPLNKMRERKRLLRGEVLPTTKALSAMMRLKRRPRIKGPPAHILSQMSPEEIRLDRVLREPSEGGYSGMVKKARGVQLGDGNLFLEREEGLAENRLWLDGLQARINDVNTQKRESYEEVSSK